MKLADLQEARYAGRHPIIKWIYEVIEGTEPFASHQFNSVEQAWQARDFVIAEFGQPQETDTDEYNYSEWMITADGQATQLEEPGRFETGPDDAGNERVHIEIGHGNRGPHAPGPDMDIQITIRSRIS